MNDFFEITGYAQEGDLHIFSIKINSKHPVFEGHFPGNPVVPGVMSMMMVRQCAEKITKRETRFENISQCKYHNVIIPDGKTLTVKLSVDEALTLKGEIFDNEGTPLLTIKGSLI